MWHSWHTSVLFLDVCRIMIFVTWPGRVCIQIQYFTCLLCQIHLDSISTTLFQIRTSRHSIPWTGVSWFLTSALSAEQTGSSWDPCNYIILKLWHFQYYLLMHVLFFVWFWAELQCLCITQTGSRTKSKVQRTHALTFMAHFSSCTCTFSSQHFFISVLVLPYPT